jgi:hypothetical protein
VRIYLSSLIELINNVGGVLNVVDLRIYNKIGQGVYSLNEISQPYINLTTRQVNISDYTLLVTQLVCLKYVDQVWILLLGLNKISLFKKCILKENTYMGCNCKNENGSIEDLNNNEPSKN